MLKLIILIIDIKEFYDNILLNETLPISKKVYETKRFADCWNQKRQPIKLATTSRPLLLNNSLEKNRYSCAPTITTTHQTIGTPTQRPIISTCLQNKFLQTPKVSFLLHKKIKLFYKKINNIVLKKLFTEKSYY